MTGLEEATAARPDGRFERSRRTRTAVIDALLELQAEGELGPSAKRVAERAGVSPRTMYLHFADMEALFVEVGDRFLARLAGIGEPVPHTGPFERRLGLFCQRRAEVLEALLPVFRSARIRQPFSAALQSNRDRYVLASDLEVDAVFAPELQALPGPSAVPRPRRGAPGHLRRRLGRPARRPRARPPVCH